MARKSEDGRAGFGAAAAKMPECLDARRIAEPDIRRQRRRLKSGKFCISEENFHEGGRNWKIFTIENRVLRDGPLFVVPHDNEDAAFVAGVYGLEKYGGALVAVEAGEKRFLEGQDPNRNFGTTRAAARRCRAQRAPAPRYTGAVLKAHRKGQPVIALHTNENGWFGNGGKGNVSIRRKGKGMPFVSAIARSRRLRDEDTLIVLAGIAPPGKDREMREKIDYFTGNAGVNVLFELVSAATNDCSLSNYAVLSGIRPYFNIEVETGDARTQKAILDKVMAYPR